MVKKSFVPVVIKEKTYSDLTIDLNNANKGTTRLFIERVTK